MPRREQELQRRRAIVQFTVEQQTSCRDVARCLELSPRTVAHWLRSDRTGLPTIALRGRPCREPTMEERIAVTVMLEESGPRLGLPTLQAYLPDAPRCVLEYLLRNYRQRFQEEHQQMVEVLQWTRPGTVWAVDHSQPPRPIDEDTQILAVRDLASGAQLAWTSVPDASSQEALLVLESLAQQYGPPIVFKSDNGSAFRSAMWGDWLARWRIVPLLSPVRMPRFNGSCEAGIGAGKSRTAYLAARQGRPLDWTADDLYAAWQWANEDHYPGGVAAGTPASRLAAREAITDATRDKFRAAVLQYELKLNQTACTTGDALSDTLIAAHHRRAVRQVLVEQGYLDITRRRIPQPLPSKKCAKIT